MTDSQVHEAVFYYENDNGGNSNMANPIDGGPGGGGVVIDGGDQPTNVYDANGNLISYKAWVYHYDAQNRLTSASNGTTNAQFYYDWKEPPDCAKHQWRDPVQLMGRLGAAGGIFFES